MSISSSPGRHRAPKTVNPLTTLSTAVTSNAGSVGRQAAVIVAASGLVLTVGLPAHGVPSAEREVQSSTALNLSPVPAEVTVPATAQVPFERVAVDVTPAPVEVAPVAPVDIAPVDVAPVAPVEVAPVAPVDVAPVAPVDVAPVAPVEVAPVEIAPAAAPVEIAPAVAPVEIAPAVAPVQVAPVVATVEVAPAAPAPQRVVVAPAPAVQQAPPADAVYVASTGGEPAPAAPSASSGVAETIAAAAESQLGVMQDCTRLVSNSLAAAGINFHGWPAGYLSLGPTVSAGEAIPGDLIYYADGGMGMAHIAVYSGNGQAVHGGFNGNSTVSAPAELGSGGVYIRVGG